MRSHKLTAILIAGAITLLLAPAAGAGKPHREEIKLVETILPGCPFDVRLTPNGREWQTTFDSGRIVVHAIGTPTLANVDTGASKRYALAYVFQETFDAKANVLVGQLSGRFNFVIWPGDIGPSGELDEDGGLVHIVGHVRYTMDPETFAITSFKLKGKITDVCAELAR